MRRRMKREFESGKREVGGEQPATKLGDDFPRIQRGVITLRKKDQKAGKKHAKPIPAKGSGFSKKRWGGPVCCGGGTLRGKRPPPIVTEAEEGKQSQLLLVVGLSSGHENERQEGIAEKRPRIRHSGSEKKRKEEREGCPFILF